MIKSIKLEGTGYPNNKAILFLENNDVTGYHYEVRLSDDYKYLTTPDFTCRVRGFESYFNKHKLIRLLNCNFVKVAGRWTVNIKAMIHYNLDTSKDIPIDIGVDVGTNTFAVTSLGTEMEINGLVKIRDKIEIVKHQLKYCDDLEEMGLQLELERLERRLKNIQTDAVHRYSNILARYKNVVVEDLKLKFYEVNDFINMIGGSRDRRNFSFDIIKQSWAMLFRQTKYKVGMRGGEVMPVPHYKTSQKCCLCFNVDKRSRKGKLYKCRKCGSKIDSDWNASVNILMLGDISNDSLKASYLMLKDAYGNDINPEYFNKRMLGLEK